MQLNFDRYKQYASPNTGLSTIFIELGTLKIWYDRKEVVAFKYRNGRLYMLAQVENKVRRLIREDAKAAICGYKSFWNKREFIESLNDAFQKTVLELSKEIVRERYNIQVAA